MMGESLKALIHASVEMADLRKENRRLREELAEARRPLMEFDLSSHEIPALCRRQAG